MVQCKVYPDVLLYSRPAPTSIRLVGAGGSPSWGVVLLGVDSGAREEGRWWNAMRKGECARREACTDRFYKTLRRAQWAIRNM